MPGNDPVETLASPRILALQRRTIIVLSLSTILGGLGVGAALSVGALLLAEVSGNDAISGLASAVFGAGAAAAGVPLARIAMRHGRRRALVTGSMLAFVGALTAILGAAIGVWPVLAVGLGLIGVASAVQLLSRFTATDLAPTRRRARDLSFVVWMITVGAVIGPNLIGPGEIVGNAIGVPPLAGVFVFASIAQALATVVSWVGLRPDPLLTARKLAEQAELQAPVPSTTDAASASSAGMSPRTARIQITATATRIAQILTIVVIAVAQILMVGLMAMTPLHLMHTGGTAEVVGLTLSLHIAGMYALSPVFGYLTNKLGRLPTIAVGIALLSAAVWLAYISGPSHLTVQLALILLGLGWSAVTVAGAVLLTDITPAEVRPKWQGLSDTCMSAAGAISGALAGVAFAIGDFSLLAIIAGLVLVGGAVVALWLALTISRSRENS
nr:MFS transporter [Leucobacter exalbidus]